MPRAGPDVGHRVPPGLAARHRPADLGDIGTVLKPGAAAVILVYENLWAAPSARTLRRNGAHLVA
ncbi:hypothetical protein AB0C29_45780, partial [Actinoplanes sp. NPDC048791]